jgi:hypothetical protein
MADFSLTTLFVVPAQVTFLVLINAEFNCRASGCVFKNALATAGRLRLPSTVAQEGRSTYTQALNSDKMLVD